MTKTKRAPKGECSIAVRSGRLRLRIPGSVYSDGKQQEIALNMADSLAGRTAAARILANVQLDIYNGELDPTLNKYKRKEITKQHTVYDLWCQYVAYKQPTIKVSTYHYYSEIIGDKLRDCPQSIVNGLEVRGWLLENTSQFYAARILKHLCSAVEWGIRHNEIDLIKNPYSYMGQEIAPNTEPPGADAFTIEEKEGVLNAFLTSHHYDYYYPFVYFLFITGCRPSEAIGLRWGDLGDDGDGFLSINFSGSIIQIKSKPIRMDKSKTNRVRKFPVNTELQDLLEAVWKDGYKPDQLIFPSRGSIDKPIDYINFSHRAWKKIVDPTIGRHATPYSCRDTFITEQIAANVPISVIAAWVDNSPHMISTRYFDVSALKFMPQS
jgi:integrase